jgi:hypothetical protein
MTIMTTHSSATVRETPHVNQTSETNTIVNALRQRAQAVLNDSSIDPQSRAVIRYALETNDPWLADLVRRADAGETIVDSAGFLITSNTDEEKIAALVEMICSAGDDAGTNSAARPFKNVSWLMVTQTLGRPMRFKPLIARCALGDGPRAFRHFICANNRDLSVHRP